MFRMCLFALGLLPKQSRNICWDWDAIDWDSCLTIWGKALEHPRSLSACLRHFAWLLTKKIPKLRSGWTPGMEKIARGCHPVGSWYSEWCVCVAPFSKWCHLCAHEEWLGEESHFGMCPSPPAGGERLIALACLSHSQAWNDNSGTAPYSWVHF